MAYSRLTESGEQCKKAWLEPESMYAPALPWDEHKEQKKKSKTVCYGDKKDAKRTGRKQLGAFVHRAKDQQRKPRKNQQIRDLDGRSNFCKENDSSLEVEVNTEVDGVGTTLRLAVTCTVRR